MNLKSAAIFLLGMAAGVAVSAAVAAISSDVEDKHKEIVIEKRAMPKPLRNFLLLRLA